MRLLIACVLLLTEPRTILSLAEAPLGAGTPPGWSTRAVRGQRAPDVDVRLAGADRVLRIQGAGRAAWFYRELSPALPVERGRLLWSWRVLESPAGADLRAERTDDSPIRVFVTFGKPGRFGRSARVIFYSYGSSEPAGYERASYASGRLHVVRMDGAPERGQWREHAVSPYDDYQRIWGRTPPEITAVGIMQDTDQTGGMASAELRRLEWVTSGP